jgi:predicted RecA/RadA family phage recombinase
MKNFVQPGNQVSVPVPYAGGVAAGQGVLVGSLFGVAVNAAAQNAPVEIAVEGVVNLAKAGSQAWTVGALVYWDNTNRVATTTASTNKLIGVALAAVGAGANETIGQVRLTGASAN